MISRRRFIYSLLLLSVTAGLHASSTAQPAQTTSGSLNQTMQRDGWWNKTFVISTFAGVRKGDDIEKVVALLSEAGLNALESNTPLEYKAEDLNTSEHLAVLKACEKHGMRYFVTDHERLTGVKNPDKEKLASLVADYSKCPALGGYYVWDEPGPDDFKAVAKSFRILRELDPAHLPLNAMVPSYGPWKDMAYYNLATQYVQTVQPDVLSFDYYALSRDASSSSGVKLSPDLYRDLALWSGLSRIHKKPLWFYPASVQWGSMATPTSATLRFQVYTAIAYGAKGIQYFTAREFTGGSIDFTHAPILANGKPGELFNDFREVNRELARLGPTLIRTTSEQVVDSSLTPQVVTPWHSLWDILESIPEHVSVALHTDRQLNKYLVIVNRQIDAPQQVTLKPLQGVKLQLLPEKTALPQDAQGAAVLSLPAGGGAMLAVSK